MACNHRIATFPIVSVSNGAGDVRPNFLAVSLAAVASGHEEPVPAISTAHQKSFVWS